MKQPPKSIAILALIFFLVILILAIYALSSERQSGNIQPLPSGDFTVPSATPEPVVGGISVSQPLFREANIVMGDKYGIGGGSGLNITAIDLEIINGENEKKIIKLDNFQAGDPEWSFNFETNSNFLTEGENTIEVVAHQKDGTVQKEKIVINVAKAPIKVAPEAIGVEWYPEGIRQSNDCGGEECDFDNYKAGVVTKGTFKGSIVYIEVLRYSMEAYVKHYFLIDGQKIYFGDNSITIEGFFDPPKIISSPDSKYSLAILPFDNNTDFLYELKTKGVLFKDEQWGNVYSTQWGCPVALIEFPDHTVSYYELRIPFIENNIPEITFIGGGKNTEEYRGASCIDYRNEDVSELMPDKRLKVAGVAGNGDYVYEFIDTDNKELKDIYNNEFTEAYDYDLKKNKYTYREFLDLHPVLFWKDPLGRWIRFTDKQFMRELELGKPVIYLYPEKKTRLSVKVAPNGGFIVTDPPYGDGWEVEAEPNGQITDLATGKKYDYLFWEGIGLNYPMKNTGWAIEKKELREFFTEKLSILGLNDREITEFNEYWVNKLSEMPYYKIYFLTQNEFNRIAPLTISPEKPQTLIRVMMTAEGLNGKIQIPEQKLPPTPERKGFTAVEWGGTLLR